MCRAWVANQSAQKTLFNWLYQALTLSISQFHNHAQYLKVTHSGRPLENRTWRLFHWAGVTADLVPPRIWSPPRSKSVSRYGLPGQNPLADLAPLSRIWSSLQKRYHSAEKKDFSYARCLKLIFFTSFASLSELWMIQKCIGDFSRNARNLPRTSFRNTKQMQKKKPLFPLHCDKPSVSVPNWIYPENGGNARFINNMHRDRLKSSFRNTLYREEALRSTKISTHLKTHDAQRRRTRDKY